MFLQHVREGKIMGTRKILLSVIVLVLVLSGILSGCGKAVDDNTLPIITAASSTTAATNTTATVPNGEISWYQDIVSQFKACQPTSIPENLTTNGTKKGGEFDVNTYFSVLTHLSMEPGYVLDYVYLVAGTAGGPILYIRKADATPFKTYDEYKAATHQTPRASNDQSMIWLVKDEANQNAGNKIKTDGTDEGYFEYALLQTLGNQFYLYGAAAVNDKRLVCEGVELEKIFTEIQSAGLKEMDTQFKTQARAIDLQPVVKPQAAAMIVQFVTFSKWGGFFKVSYLMNHDYPHTIFSYANDPLLAYDSGAAY